MRTLLVEGQGNFGSVDGDPPAAMRYTEVRLAAPAMELLADIRKNTVDFSDNFDGSLQEPDVLPAALPNLLVNGATGIAVGMATSIPPHNLGEVVDALIYMLENWSRLDDVNVEDLMRFIQGPDFPTGGLILPQSGDEDLTTAYGTGRGRMTVQARAHLEEMSRGRNRIIVSELPYMTNKSALIERIAELAREERVEGIADLRDESDRHGLRIVIELTKTADPEKVLQELYKSTPMRTTFSLILLALVDGEPRMLTLKQALRVYLDHRLVVTRRRSEFDLEKARQRAHILEGLRIALKYLDEVIALIRKAPDAETARERLVKRFKLTEIQAQAILDMPLRRLAALERKKIEDEYKEVKVSINELEALLRSPLKMRQVVSQELKAVKDAYADRRRTQIVPLGAGSSGAAPLLVAADLVPERNIWVMAAADGLMARTLGEDAPRLSGNAAPRWVLRANTRDTLYVVNEQGEAAGLPVHALPEAESPQMGVPLHKVSALAEGSRLVALFTLPPKDERAKNWFVFTATCQGMVKKTGLAELPGATARSFTLVKVNEGDRLGWVRLTDGKADLLLATKDGMAIRFSENEVRPMGLAAAGVGGIKLGVRDELAGMDVVPIRGEIVLFSSDGKAKRLPPEQFPRQGRYGQGVVAWKLPRTVELVGLATGKGSARVTLLLDKLAPKVFRLDEAPAQTRSASGKAVVELKAGDRLQAVILPYEPLRPSIHATLPAVEVDQPRRVRQTKKASPVRAESSSEESVKEAPAMVEKPARDRVKAGAETHPPVKTTRARIKSGAEAVEKPAATKAPRARAKSTEATTAPEKPAQAKTTTVQAGKSASRSAQQTRAAESTTEPSKRKPTRSRLKDPIEQKPSEAKASPGGVKKTTSTGGVAAEKRPVITSTKRTGLKSNLESSPEAKPKRGPAKSTPEKKSSTQSSRVPRSSSVKTPSKGKSGSDKATQLSLIVPLETPPARRGRKPKTTQSP